MIDPDFGPLDPSSVASFLPGGMGENDALRTMSALLCSWDRIRMSCFLWAEPLIGHSQRGGVRLPLHLSFFISSCSVGLEDLLTGYLVLDYFLLCGGLPRYLGDVHRYSHLLFLCFLLGFFL